MILNESKGRTRVFFLAKQDETQISFYLFLDRGVVVEPL